MLETTSTKSNISDSLIEEISPGGSDPHYFEWQEAWYPVHYLEDLDKSKPTPFTLLGRNIVIWWVDTHPLTAFTV